MVCSVEMYQAASQVCGIGILIPQCLNFSCVTLNFELYVLPEFSYLSVPLYEYTFVSLRLSCMHACVDFYLLQG